MFFFDTSSPIPLAGLLSSLRGVWLDVDDAALYPSCTSC